MNKSIPKAIPGSYKISVSSRKEEGEGGRKFFSLTS